MSTEHTHEYVTAEQLIRVELDLQDPAQPPLPGMPDPRHGVTVYSDALDCSVDAYAYASGGAWWYWVNPGHAAVVHMSETVRDGDTLERVERRVMEALSDLHPSVEWFDLEDLERRYTLEPDMEGRDALIYAALRDLLEYETPRRWVGLATVTYSPEANDD